MTDLIQIKNCIYTFRNQKVILDRDLAEMYGVPTRVLNQAVKRNIDRFPSDFMFQLSEEELNNWKSQFVTSNSIKMGLRKNPYAFTELGVAMLSSVLRSQTAIQTNICIMRAFVAVRQAISEMNSTENRLSLLERNFTELKAELEEIFEDYNDINEDTRTQLELINKSLAEMNIPDLSERKKRPKIGFVPPNIKK